MKIIPNQKDILIESRPAVKALQTRHGIIRLNPAKWTLYRRCWRRNSTINGAASLQRENDLGSIELGKKADIIILDCNKSHLVPNHSYISNIVYAANGNDVDSTIINGLPIMLNKELINIDKNKILEEAEIVAKNLTSGV